MLFVSLRGVQIGTEKLAINQRSGGQLCTRFLGSQVHADGSGPGSQVHAGLLLSPVRSIFCACIRLLCVFQFCVSHVRGPVFFQFMGHGQKNIKKQVPFTLLVTWYNMLLSLCHATLFVLVCYALLSFCVFHVLGHGTYGLLGMY